MEIEERMKSERNAQGGLKDEIEDYQVFRPNKQ